MRLPSRNIYILFFVLYSIPVLAQPVQFADPVKIPVFLSGNFAELRPNHFHGGIDIKIQQTIGIPIYSIEDGFVYRIVVSPTGYGKAVYIEHAGGFSSVYAHLDRFSEEIEAYVRTEQYGRKSFAVDLSPDKNGLVIEKGQLIGFGGNSGSSGGPHLHFEIRDTKTQDALNPLAFGFSVTDNVPPRFYNLFAYPVSENSHIASSFSRRSFRLAASANQYTLQPNEEMEAFGEIGFAIRANDYYDGSHNICGIYSAQMKVNGEVRFAYTFDRMPFADTRYMNSHIDYEMSVKGGARIHRLWRQPGNRLGIYHTETDRGLIVVEEGKLYAVEIIINDIAGNTARMSFKIRGKDRNIRKPLVANAHFFTYDDDNMFRTPFIELFAPAGAFYDDFYYRYNVTPRTPDLFSKAHSLHTETEPIHHPVRIRLLTEGLPENLIEKSFIGRISENGRKSYVGGAYEQGWYEAEIRSFGTYAVMTDTIPPVITPLSIRERNTLTESNQIGREHV